ncbi:UNVERIFIED_CONTAM: hypothetical protein Sradi_3008000 [Sesamum radiatum]|uniref:Uncharacterized protein n=1 Tax=Sesamum radiatum TaxID=300843 RepID=A0AAW2S202_SESRA
MKKTSFASLFSNNRKLNDENKLKKFTADDETLKLSSNDLIDLQIKLGYCFVDYIASKFPGLKAIRALAQSWETSFQQYDSVGGSSSNLQEMKTGNSSFEFKEDDISLKLQFGPSFRPSHLNVGILTHLTRLDLDWALQFPWIH